MSFETFESARDSVARTRSIYERALENLHSLRIAQIENALVYVGYPTSVKSNETGNQITCIAKDADGKDVLVEGFAMTDEIHGDEKSVLESKYVRFSAYSDKKSFIDLEGVDPKAEYAVGEIWYSIQVASKDAATAMRQLVEWLKLFTDKE